MHHQKISFPLLRGAILLLFQCSLIYKHLSPPNSPHTSHDSYVIIQPEEGNITLFNPGSISLLLTPSNPLSVSSKFDVRKSTINNINFGRSPSTWFTALLILSGDIELNPGPRSVRYPCKECGRACTSNPESIQCDSCESWIHVKCLGMSPQVFGVLANSSL